VKRAGNQGFGDKDKDNILGKAENLKKACHRKALQRDRQREEEDGAEDMMEMGLQMRYVTSYPQKAYS